MGYRNPKLPNVAFHSARQLRNISLMEMVTALPSNSNGGNKIKPNALTAIEDEQGKFLYEAKALIPRNA